MCEPINGGEVETVAGLGIFGPVAPQRHHLVAVDNDLRIETAQLIRLEAIPGRAKFLAVARHVWATTIAAIGKAFCLVDRDAFRVCGGHARGVAALDGVEQGLDSASVDLRL
jgi:hypothetical protein